MWNCTCGFLEADETAEGGCNRETYEETGYIIPPSEFNLVGVETDPAVCNNGNVTLRYVAILDKPPIKGMPIGGEKDEVDEVKWIPLTEIDNYVWAFNHRQRIYDIFQQWVAQSHGRSSNICSICS